MRKPRIQSPTGMHDILPDDQKYFKKVYDVVENIADFSGFEKIDTPILEQTKLFEKGTGSSTEIVEKQMYSFRTKGDDYLSLRPELTPSILRAYIQHGMFNLPQPVKLFSMGPLFRHENPQAGRYRQFHQFSFEVLGDQSPVTDAQIIQVSFNILKALSFKDLIIEINSVGDSQCRPYYKKLLNSYFRSYKTSLCPDCKRRRKTNVLRILDCKEKKCQMIVSQAPQTIDHLCQECHNHFKGVLEFLDGLEMPYRLNTHLVRGLDYYTKTVFEIYEQGEQGSKQGALIGGGRYDALAKILSSREVAGSGMAGGIERIINLMKARKQKIQEVPLPKIFLAQLGLLAKRRSLKLFEDFRKSKIRVAESFSKDSLGPQLTKANKIGVKYTLILGQREALEETIIIRDMKTGRQKTVKLKNILAEMRKRLKKL